MSIDLELRRDLPEIQELRQDSPEIKLPRLKIDRNIDDNHHNQEDQEEECRTPKSPRSLIPVILSCPPAPKKPPRSAVPPCKRKLCFLEFVRTDEIESFFRMAYDLTVDSSGSDKRSKS